jgi:hypothetical protein
LRPNAHNAPVFLRAACGISGNAGEIFAVGRFRADTDGRHEQIVLDEENQHGTT